MDSCTLVKTEKKDEPKTEKKTKPKTEKKDTRYMHPCRDAVTEKKGASSCPNGKACPWSHAPTCKNGTSCWNPACTFGHYRSDAETDPKSVFCCAKGRKKGEKCERLACFLKH